MCDVLKEIYKKVYNEQFKYAELDHRIKLQKAVYILENMGIHVGDYSFSWNKYGPYSLELDSDAMKNQSGKEKNVTFSQTAEKAFEKIREILDNKISYSQTQWMECITSLHYLMNVFMIRDDEVMEKLRKEKSYLSNLEANSKALSYAKTIKMVY